MTKIIPFTPKEMSYTDQTGQFPFHSTRGYEYIMVLYDFDSNAILARPFKNRQAKELVDTWKKLYDDLTKNGHTTNCFIMDNECSSEMKSALKNFKLSYQLVPPDIHRRNSAERAINRKFPIREWDRLLPHATMTINMLRNTRINPSLSSYTYLFGNHDFAKHPLAPFGLKVTIHNITNTRGSW